ncbi:molybdenum cofactor biosynthesis protein [Trypanosoma rangeli]|uniref:Molybdenum cofactor biosynthesis protein n=1 Tax=Trypanosoma rangeli TaxID=5698 RepID=A0A3R7NQ65_TRYRA|nr:molybdenum cofactor biosynthesis protein [Trypanosoma rangeli]RNF05985.1 molybdenum cofactor biosynthesis protein [Trypanosoma rangeli]|eukprot:RNF05985.1 molybdenum cofactor biosynthesis protein [Trypanosoma rangeli]
MRLRGNAPTVSIGKTAGGAADRDLAKPMFRLTAALLAKKKPVKPLPRRGRAAAITTARRTTKSPAKRRLPSRPRTRTPAARSRMTAAAVAPSTSAGNHQHHDSRGGGGGGGNVGNSNNTDSTDNSHGDPDSNVVVQATKETQTEASEKKSPYCLATAVSTLVVPPAANFLLEGMKQTLTPSLQKPNDGGVGSSSSEENRSPVSQMEEFYTSKKGPLFATAVVAGTNAVKQASQLIPFCHPVRIQKCSFTFRRRLVAGLSHTSALPHRVVLRKRVSPPPPPSCARRDCSVLYCFCTVASDDSKAGVEMEALTGASVASLTLYDMLRGLPGSQEDGLSIGESFVLAKRGGKSDFTKLLMSEPEAATQPSPFTLPTLAPSATADTEQEATAGTGGMATEGDTAPPSSSPASQAETQREREEGGDDKDNKEVHSPSSGSGAAAHAQPHPQAERSRTLGDADAHEVTTDALGEKGAWWESTARDKKLQQLRPRRRYEVQEKAPLKEELPPTERAKVAPASAAVTTTPRRMQQAKVHPTKLIKNKMRARLKLSSKVAKLRPKRFAAPAVRRRMESSAHDDEDDSPLGGEEYDESTDDAAAAEAKKKGKREAAATANAKHVSLRKTASHDAITDDFDGGDGGGGGGGHSGQV